LQFNTLVTPQTRTTNTNPSGSAVKKFVLGDNCAYGIITTNPINPVLPMGCGLVVILFLPFSTLISELFLLES
jgi:hypothetical protein